MTSISDPFVASLAEVRWFEAIGQPLQVEGVVRLASWSEWPGPEDPRVETFFINQQSFKDELESSLGCQRSELVALWDVIHRRVLETAGPVIGHDPTEDAWHGPSTATWHAAWTAGLLAWCQALKHPAPDWLVQQWAWFRRGRWPAGYASLDENGKGRGCLVL
jgi:hypothetical protein